MSSWDEDTRPNLLRPSLVQAAAATDPADDDTQLGMLMRQTVKNTRAIEQLSTDMGTLSRELRSTTRGLESDRPELAAQAAKHGSNRAVALVGTLFTIYEVSSPYLREIWRQIVHR